MGASAEPEIENVVFLLMNASLSKHNFLLFVFWKARLC